MESITVKVSVQKTAKECWEFWTKPEHITGWNFASDDWCCPRAKNDLKVGGRFNVRMEAKDGSAGFDFEGTYDELIDTKKIVYHMDDNRKVTILFAGNKDNTLIMETFDTEDMNTAQQQRQGWQSILNNFKSYAENK